MTISAVSAKIETRRDIAPPTTPRPQVREGGESRFENAPPKTLTRLVAAPVAQVTTPRLTLRNRLANWLERNDRDVRKWQKFDRTLDVDDPLASPKVNHVTSLIKNVAYGVGYLAFPLAGTIIANKLGDNFYMIKPPVKKYAFAMGTAVVRGLNLLLRVAPTHAAFAALHLVAGAPPR